MYFFLFGQNKYLCLSVLFILYVFAPFEYILFSFILNIIRFKRYKKRVQIIIN